jgi:hypothetical protein
LWDIKTISCIHINFRTSFWKHCFGKGQSTQFLANQLEAANINKSYMTQQSPKQENNIEFLLGQINWKFKEQLVEKIIMFTKKILHPCPPSLISATQVPTNKMLSLSLSPNPSHLKFQQCQSYGSLTGQLSFPHQTISHI